MPGVLERRRILGSQWASNRESNRKCQVSGCATRQNPIASLCSVVVRQPPLHTGEAASVWKMRGSESHNIAGPLTLFPQMTSVEGPKPGNKDVVLPLPGPPNRPGAGGRRWVRLGSGTLNSQRGRSVQVHQPPIGRTSAESSHSCTMGVHPYPEKEEGGQKTAEVGPAETLSRPCIGIIASKLGLRGHGRYVTPASPSFHVFGLI